MRIFFNNPNGFFSEIKQINSLFTVKFFNVVQKYAIDSRFCSISIREIVWKRRSKLNLFSLNKNKKKSEFYQLNLYLKINDHSLYLNLIQLLYELYFGDYLHCLLETK